MELKIILKKLLLLFIMAPFAALAQGQGDTLTISGRVNLLIGLDMVPAQVILVTIKNNGQVTTTDSLGTFKLVKLKPGNHQIKVIGDGFPNIDTTITIADKPVTALNLLAFANCGINQDIAYRDIKNHHPRLLLVGGIAPVVYLHQEKFEKKYDVKYDDFGCLAPNRECILKYNKAVFKYLDSRYGKKWRKEVRKDVIGL